MQLKPPGRFGLQSTALAIGAITLCSGCAQFANLPVISAPPTSGLPTAQIRTAKPKPAAATTNRKVWMIQGMKVEDLRMGHGPVARNKMVVTTDYRGMLKNGTVFDESYRRGLPFEFNLGAGQVIEGWEKGVPGMRVGGKRRLTIPPAWAYRAQGSPPTIPPNATLIFDIELRQVR